MTLAIVDEDILRYVRVKKKAYVRLVTNLGNLNLELHSDMVITCAWFALCVPVSLESVWMFI